MSRRRASLKFRAEFYARKHEWPAYFNLSEAAQKAWSDGYRAAQRDAKASRGPTHRPKTKA